MNYSNLFNTIHSEVISEEVKEELVSKVLDKLVLANEDLLVESINEDNSKVASYVEALSLLVNSNMTNEALDEAIDEIFSNENQETIDLVTEAFKEDVVRGILVEKLLDDANLSEGIFKENKRPVGLSGIKRTSYAEAPKTEAPKAEAPKSETPRTEAPKAGAKKNPLYVVKNSDGTYRGGRTQELKKTVEKARAHKEAKATRVEANKSKTEANLSKTGSSKPIELGGAVKQARGLRSATLKATGIDPEGTPKATSNSKPASGAALSVARRAIGTDPFEKTDLKTPETKIEKVERLAGNKGAQQAVRHSNKPYNGQLSLFNDSTENKEETTTPKAETTTPKAETTTPKAETTTPKAETQEPKKPKRGRTKKNTEETNANETPKTQEVSNSDKKGKTSSSVFIKGGNEPSTPKKNESYDAPKLEQKLWAVRDDLKDMRALGNTDSPEYIAKKKELSELKKLVKQAAAHESLTNSFATLFKSNISESSLREICEMVSASRKNADKALKRHEERVNNAIDDMYHHLEKTREIDPDLAKKAADAGARKMAFERRYNNKFKKES